MMVLCVSAVASLAVIVAAGPAPEVRGATACPSAQEVAARLSPMLAADATFPSGDFIEIADVPARAAGLLDVEIRLRQLGADAPVAVRRVERAGGCSETTDAVAVIAASWAGRFSTPGPPPEPLSASPPAAGASVRAVVAATPPPPLRAAPRFSLGVIFAATTATAGGAAPLAGGELEARRGRWDLRLAAVGMGERTLSFAPGGATWRRLVLHPSLGFRWGSHFAFAQIDAGPLLAVTETKGTGFAANGREVAFELGVAPGIRVGAGLATLPIQLWLGATALIWLRPHTVAVEDAAQTRTIPFLDLCLGGGLGFLFGADS